MQPSPSPLYTPPDLAVWAGRVDSTFDTSMQRWHQAVTPVNIFAPAESQPPAPGFAMLGFACEAGVARNKGRLGAAQGPTALRSATANLPAGVLEGTPLYDVGNVICQGNALEDAQEALGQAVHRLLQYKQRPLVLGGGHEVAYGHYLGLWQYLKEQHPGSPPVLGIVNFDAHWDLREPEPGIGPSSGTPFLQMARQQQSQQAPFHYMAIGIQPTSNTPNLYQTAEHLGAQHMAPPHWGGPALPKAMYRLKQFIAKVDALYLTIDLDVFAAAYAPGVSAPAYIGIAPDPAFFALYQCVLQSGKLLSMDIAELNPNHDIDNRTAKLAAGLLFHATQHWGARPQQP